MASPDDFFVTGPNFQQKLATKLELTPQGGVQGPLAQFLAGLFAGGTAVNVLDVTQDDGVTAFPTGGQSGAVVLTGTVNRVTTVGTAADSVALQPATPGAIQFVVNDASANSMQVFGQGTDTINDVAHGTGVAQAAGKSAVYFCTVAGKWYRVLSA